MQLVFNQEIYYSNKEHLPLKEVALALLALEKTHPLLVQTIENIFIDAKIIKTELFIETLESGSLREQIKYYLYFIFQKQIKDHTGIELPQLDQQPDSTKIKIIGALLALCIAYAAWEAANLYGNKQEKPNLEKQVNIYLQASGDIIGIDPQTIKEAVAKSTKVHPETLKATVEFAKPAKRDPSASISINNDVVLTPEALSEMPGHFPDDESVEKVVELTEVEIFIRATDKDSGKKGWGAQIPDFMQRRMKLHISPGIDLIFLAHQDVIVGNVSIFYTVDENGAITKPHAHLHHVYVEKTKIENKGLQ